MKFNTTSVRTAPVDSPLGGVTLAATNRGLAAQWFDAQRHASDTAGWQRADGGSGGTPPARVSRRAGGSA
ncbi:MAG: cysteine methyltransferase [Variovorax sp.]|nr:cysteine methyltransferase [Variovorax sp.]